MRVIDLFAGPGGWDTGLSMLSPSDLNLLGIEWDATACATATAAGHPRLKADIAELDPWTTTLEHLDGIDGLIASPPCQGFSLAGKGQGRRDAAEILAAVEDLGKGNDTRDELRVNVKDARSALVLEPLRWALDLTPDWMAWEQVPAVLPLWQACAEVLENFGYSVATGNVHAEQYGVPQTRKRAILIASRTQRVALPAPTHSKYHNRTPDRLDPGVLPWVSMAEALSWGLTNRPAYTVVAGGQRSSHYGSEWGSGAVRKKLLALSESDSPEWIRKGEWDATDLVGFPRRYDGRGGVFELDGQQYRARDMRSASQPAQTVTEKARSWNRYQVDKAKVVEIVEPRVNNQSGTVFDLGWPADRPAPTIASRGLVGMPGSNANRFQPGATKSRNDGIRVTASEAGILQSFPEDYPWQGNRGQQYRQIGDAVPPLLAAHILNAAGATQALAERKAA